MCREFVGTASCVKTAGRRGYNRTAYRETRGGQTDPGTGTGGCYREYCTCEKES